MRIFGYVAITLSLAMVNASGSANASLNSGLQDEKQPNAAESGNASSAEGAESTEPSSPSTRATTGEEKEAKEMPHAKKKNRASDERLHSAAKKQSAAPHFSDDFAPMPPKAPAEIGPGFIDDDNGEKNEAKNRGFDDVVSNADPTDKVDPAKDVNGLDQLRTRIGEVKNAASELRDILKEIVELQSSIHPGATAAVAAPPGPKAGKVFLISVADTNDNAIGAGAAANSATIRAVVEKQCGVLGVPVVPVNVEGIRFQFSVLKTVCNDLKQKVTSADTVFMYVSAHGAYSGDQHFFQMPNGSGRNSVLRREIWSLIKNLGARQTILMSDSCSLQTTPQAATAAFGIDASVAFDSEDNSLGYLLTYQVGDFDINASSKAPSDNGSGSPRAARKGEFAIYPSDGGGGLFTRSFVTAAKASEGSPWSWRKLMNATQTSMDFYTRPGIRTSTPFGTITIRKQTWELIP